jgi:hypothetical protein
MSEKVAFGNRFANAWQRLIDVDLDAIALACDNELTWGRYFDLPLCLIGLELDLQIFTDSNITIPLRKFGARLWLEQEFPASAGQREDPSIQPSLHSQSLYALSMQIRARLWASDMSAGVISVDFHPDRSRFFHREVSHL